MYCLIFIGIGLVSVVAMFLQVIHVLSNLYWYRIGQLGRYVLRGNTLLSFYNAMSEFHRNGPCYKYQYVWDNPSEYNGLMNLRKIKSHIFTFL